MQKMGRARKIGEWYNMSDLPKIKFSHKYCKMPDDLNGDTELLAVVKKNRRDLKDDFVEYDTQYEGNDFDESNENYENYPLPHGDILILFLFTSWDEGSCVWTTIRRSTPEKDKYYTSLVGMMVQPIIVEED